MAYIRHSSLAGTLDYTRGGEGVGDVSGRPVARGDTRLGGAACGKRLCMFGSCCFGCGMQNMGFLGCVMSDGVPGVGLVNGCLVMSRLNDV
jgi:hypothetical protein